MVWRIASSFTALSLLGAAAAAEVPRVVADIAPVHSLVSQVMGELGAPAMIIPAGASPHGYAMRPSEARALSGAGLIVWMGASLEPWLEHSIETLAPGARTLPLEQVAGTILLEARDGAVFAAPHDAKAAPDAESAGDSGHDHGDDHDHAGAGIDPHSWLDPENGILWLAAIAGALADLDPENAATYRANATDAIAVLRDQEARIAESFSGLGDRRFVVLHDAFQYFEARFDLPAVGALSRSDATAPSAARVDALRDEIRAESIACIVTLPQANTSLIAAIAEGQDVGRAELDPIGVALEPGPDLYGALLQGLADGLKDCR